jgi:hypothetical protein
MLTEVAAGPRLSLGRRVAVRALVSYVITFAILRVITAIIYYDIFPNGPFHFVMTKSGIHIHHLFRDRSSRD